MKTKYIYLKKLPLQLIHWVDEIFSNYDKKCVRGATEITLPRPIAEGPLISVYIHGIKKYTPLKSITFEHCADKISEKNLWEIKNHVLNLTRNNNERYKIIFRDCNREWALK